ncbi:hypothetical protein [Exiguobacterium mexicanum]|uniref:hypothetical protein n=1 Tax=Exiguobacterium mexicanum TaxID=340146 RepID=UPI0037BF77F6
MNGNLDIVFLGGLFPKEIETTISENSKGNVQNAANNLQWEIVLGIDSNIDDKLKIINSLYIGSYPKRYKKIFIPTTKFAHSLEGNDAQDVNVGFVNLTGFKNYHRYHTLKPFLKEWAETNTSKKK